MPYEMRKDGPEGKQWCVYNKVTGKRKGCSVTEKLAKEFMAKLYVEEGKKDMETKAVWSTAFMNNLPDSSFLYVESGKKEDGKTTPRSLRHLPYKDASGKVDLPHLRNAIARASKVKDKNGKPLSAALVSRIQARARKLLAAHGGKKELEDLAINVEEATEDYLIVKDTEGILYKASYNITEEDEFSIAEKEDWQEVEVEYIEKESAPVEWTKESIAEYVREVQKGDSLMDKVKQLWDKVFPPEPVPLFVTKQQEDGRFRWVMISSTAFLDGEEEIVSTKALADNQPLAEKDYGELRFWHLPIKLGSGDFQMADGVCLVESGLWDDNEIADPVRKAIDEKPRDWKASIGFLPLQDPSENVLVKSTIVKKVWDAIQIKERSVLPKKYAANKFACIMTEGGITVDEKKEKVLRELLGDDLATQVISNVDGLNKKALEDDAVVKGQEEPTPDPASALEPIPEKEVTIEELKEVLKELGSLPDRFKKLEDDMQKLRDDVAPRGTVHKASDDPETTVSTEEATELVGPTELKAIDDIVDTMLGEN